MYLLLSTRSNTAADATPPEEGAAEEVKTSHGEGHAESTHLASKGAGSRDSAADAEGEHGSNHS